MNFIRNLEAICIVAVCLNCLTAFASLPEVHIGNGQIAVDGGKMVSVTVSAKRMTAAEKAQLGL